MDTFMDLRRELTALDRTNDRVRYDENTGTLTVIGEKYLFAANGNADGSVCLSVSEGRKRASFAYSCEQAFKVLSGVVTGEKEVKVNFVPDPKKASVVRSVLAIGLGAVLALGNLFLSTAMIGGFLTGVDASEAYAYIAPALFFVIMTVLGIGLVCAGVRGKTSGGRLLGISIGTLFAAIAVTMIVLIWGSRATDPDTELYVYIVLTVVFGVLLASGVMLFMYSARSTNAGAFRRLPWLIVLPTQAQIALLEEEIRRRTRTEAIRYTLDYERRPSLYESKVGGVPYWDMLMPYPVSEVGEKLILLAQFNLGELPENDVFPKEGMLQFFVAADEMYGLGSDCKVVYHRTLRQSVHEKDVLALGVPTSCIGDDQGESPVCGEFAVSFSKEEVCMTPCDSRFESLVFSTARELGIDIEADTPACMLFDDSFGLTYGNFLLGYPEFTQEDPRDESAREKYDVMLMQLGSDSNRSFPEKFVMWGDCGVGTFFINSSALAEMNFDDVLYNWDCC